MFNEEAQNSDVAPFLASLPPDLETSSKACFTLLRRLDMIRTNIIWPKNVCLFPRLGHVNCNYSEKIIVLCMTDGSRTPKKLVVSISRFDYWIAKMLRDLQSIVTKTVANVSAYLLHSAFDRSLLVICSENRWHC